MHGGQLPGERIIIPQISENGDNVTNEAKTKQTKHGSKPSLLNGLAAHVECSGFEVEFSVASRVHRDHRDRTDY